MHQISDWNELRDKIHANAVEHGFWEYNPSPEHFLCLVISELMESVEAHRKSKHADINSFEKRIDEPISKHEAATPVERLRYWFNSYIKDSVEDELADAVIRILDLAGGIKVSLSSLYDSSMVVDSLKYISAKNTFTENIYTVVRFITCEMNLSFRLTIALRMIEAVADIYDVDLSWHIREKILYNIFRSYKHGKNY